jgi:lipid A disaccharide synthetase
VAHEKLAVRGYVEVLRHYREIVGIRDSCATAAGGAARLFIGVDAPDFNLDLEPTCGQPASRPCTSSARRSGPGA